MQIWLGHVELKMAVGPPTLTPKRYVGGCRNWKYRLRNYKSIKESVSNEKKKNIRETPSKDQNPFIGLTFQGHGQP